MTLEQKEKKPSFQDLESLVAKKEVSLPKSVSKYIRNLKARGEWKKAIEVAKQVRERKEQQQRKWAGGELNRTILELLEATDPEKESELEIKAIWLLFASGEIGFDERRDELLQTIDSKGPRLRDFLEGKLHGIRVEAMSLVPSSPTSRKRR